MSERTILVLGASGLIGRFVTDDLRARGFRVVGVARSLSPAQRMSALDIDLPILILDAAALTRLLNEHAVSIVVNCLGVLQDGPGSSTGAVHRDFVARLLQAIGDSDRAIRLVHISIPGVAESDRTAFATTKREAERLIGTSGIPHAILRPGFVIAPSAYGGSTMLRALAAFPVDLPAKEMATPFHPVAIEDIAATIAWLAARDIDDASVKAVSWDLMQAEPVTMAGVIKQFRFAFGTEGWPRIAVPTFMLDLSARLGDLANYLGWMPPMRSTAIAELRRGVIGDPSAWIAATGIAPKTLADAVGRHPATIQDKWFARLFLTKALSPREPCRILDRLGLHRAVRILPCRRRHFERARLPARAGRSHHHRHQPDGHEHRRADRLPPDRGDRPDRRYFRFARLYGRRGDSDARPLDRTARCAGENGAGDRADAGRAPDAG